MKNLKHEAMNILINLGNYSHDELSITETKSIGTIMNQNKYIALSSDKIEAMSYLSPLIVQMKERNLNIVVDTEMDILSQHLLKLSSKDRRFLFSEVPALAFLAGAMPQIDRSNPPNGNELLIINAQRALWTILHTFKGTATQLHSLSETFETLGFKSKRLKGIPGATFKKKEPEDFLMTVRKKSMSIAEITSIADEEDLHQEIINILELFPLNIF